MRKFFRKVREVLDKNVVSPEELILKTEKASGLIFTAAFSLALMVVMPLIIFVIFIFALGEAQGADLSFLLILIFAIFMLIFIFSAIILNILYVFLVIPRKYRSFVGGDYGDLHMLRYIYEQEQEKERQASKRMKDYVPRTTIRHQKSE